MSQESRVAGSDTTPVDDDQRLIDQPEPLPEPLLRFLGSGWGDRRPEAMRSPVADQTEPRRALLTAEFPGERLVLPAGGTKVRNYDMLHRFRVDTAHAYYAGNHECDAVLVASDDGSVLYARPSAGRDTEEFFRDLHYGEFWVGRRPSLAELCESLGLEVRHLDRLEEDLRRAGPIRVHRGVDSRVDALVTPDEHRDTELRQRASELRMVKTEWEVDQLRQAVALTVQGYEDVARDWDNAIAHGARWIEGTFYRRALAMGNEVGYDSVVASGRHATTLHWNGNHGPVTPGELVLMDMGVEHTSLYTADICRTVPVDGRFTALQREVYEVVRAAQTAGIAAVVPGAPYHDISTASTAVLAHGLADLGLLPVSVEEALDPGSRVYSRWTIHGPGHMLGMDVHDCGRAVAANYTDALLTPGMVFTVEPGLYFRDDDLLVPPELRGIGIRIEDDVLVTPTGSEVLSTDLPREPDQVETWLQEQREHAPTPASVGKEGVRG